MAALVASAHASQSWDGQLKRRDAGTPKYDPNHRCGATSVKNFMCDKKSEFPCCSVDGFCGITARHCGAGCQVNYSSCEVRPIVEKDYKRTLSGDVPYGQALYSCTKPNMIAFGMSNGPTKETPALLDYLKTADVKVTFFMDSNNFGSIQTPDNIKTVQRMINEGHQVATQSDSHPDFTTLSKAEMQTQLSTFEALVGPILGGQTPTYFRPPYLKCNKDCLDVAKSMGYHVITANIDPREKPAGEVTSTSVKKVFTEEFEKAKATGQSFIAYLSDLYDDTGKPAISAAIDLAKDYGLKIVTVGDCLGDNDPANWYRAYLKDDGKPI
jgi:peptidoglycan/xylan/chitin deacetylase (PgdA/CDA1 family)